MIGRKSELWDLSFILPKLLLSLNLHFHSNDAVPITYCFVLPGVFLITSVRPQILHVLYSVPKTRALPETEYKINVDLISRYQLVILYLVIS